MSATKKTPTKTVSARLPMGLVKRIERLAAAMTEQQKMTITTSRVLEVMINTQLGAMEEAYVSPPTA